MDSDDRTAARDDADNTAGDTDVDQTSTTIIGANLTGLNAAPFPGGVVGPAAGIASDEAADDGVGPLNLDALGQGGIGSGATGDQGVSADQRELEADELNG